MKEKTCGIGKSALFIPQFIFKSSCSKHDSYYEIGGDVIDKIYADAMFYALMLEDIRKVSHSILMRYFYFLMATLYLILVSVFGIIVFNWFDYKGKFIKYIWKF
jgi:hypothetical protein